MAEFRIDRLKFRWIGDWTPGLTYTKDDVIKYNGKAYVCLQQHIASANFYVDQNEVPQTITYAVTVGPDTLNGTDHGTFYLNGVENPHLLLLKGRTYIFNQNDLSNKTYNSEVHPLLFSNIENGTLNGGYDYTINVSYFINNIAVTKETYLENFGVSNFRQIRITVPETAPKALFYYSPYNTGMGNRLETRYSSHWELMFDGREWFGDWQAETYYPLDTLVKFKGYIYKCVTPHTSTGVIGEDLTDDITNWTFYNFGSNWLDTWQPETRYTLGDIVRYYGVTYLCIENHVSSSDTNSGLEANETSWMIVSRSDNWRSEWTASTRYATDDVVRYGAIVYRCIAEHTSGESNSVGLEFNQSNWEVVHEGVDYKGNWTPSTRYKKGDVVKYGPGLWKATIGHIAGLSLRADESNWTVYVPGVGYEDVWDSFTEYKKGDIVTYGGYTYIALQNNLNSIPSVNGIVQDTGNWELLTTGYNHRGEWSALAVYRTGDIVRNNGYLYISVADSANVQPDSDPTKWQLIVPGSYWQAEWNEVNEYYIGDVVTYAGTAYSCVLRHEGTATNSRPDLDISQTYWVVLIQGAVDNVLTTRGDLKVYDTTNTRLAIGNPGEVLKVDGTLPIWDSFNQVPKVFYVSVEGTDGPEFGTQLSAPFRTVKYACDFIRADEANRAPATIFIKTGYYEEVLPIIVPANVALVGDELRSTTIVPADGYESSNMFYVRNGSGIRNMTLQGLTGTLGNPNQFLTRRPTAGAFVSLDPGTGPGDSSTWITTKSPYIQNVSTFGTACIGMKIDGSLHNGGNKSVVANDFTQVLSDGIGYWATNGGRSELVSVFTYFCHIGYLADNGGILRATNGNNSYGTYGSVAEGFDSSEIPITGVVNNRTNEALVDEIFTYGTTEQQILATGYLHAGQNYTSASIAYAGSGINAAGSYDEFRNGAISNIRVTAAGDSSTPGGRGYQYVVNNSQGGDTGTITLAAADIGTAAFYVGQRIVILSGKGVGQYATITAFNETTKQAIVSKESDGSQGWEHFQPGWPIEAVLDETTRYAIEPAVLIATPAVNVSPLTVTGSYKWKYIVHGTRYVAVSSGEGQTAYSTNSSNGSSWATPLSLGTDVINGLVYTGTKYLALRKSTSVGGALNTILQSSNGETWGTVTLPATKIWEAIASDKSGNVVIIASDGTVLYSNDDGDTWSASSITTTGEEWSVAFYGNGKFVVLDNAEGKVAYSTNNGVTWTSISVFSPGTLWSDITYGNGRFVAISSTDNLVARSFDGINWYTTTISIGTFSRVSYGGGLFIASGTGDRLATSQGGDTWRTFADDSTTYTTTASATWQGSAYNNGNWILVSESTTWNTIQTGSKPLIRVKIENERVTKFIIYDPGSHLTDTDITVFDNRVTVNVVPTVYVNDGVLSQPTMSNRGEGYVTATATITGDGYAEIYQTGRYLWVSNLNRVPGPGDNLDISDITDRQYSVTEILELSGTGPYSARLTISPFLDVEESPIHGTTLEIRQKYSQIRLTGHDFLDIGTGNRVDTDYPDLYLVGFQPVNEPQPFNETVANGGGRVFYTSTDQDGNFRVGELFQVEQARGVVTISASQFNLSGLTEISLGGIQVGGSAVVIREFSTDPTFIADSNNIVPTQRAIKRYLESRITGGSSNAQTNTLIAGQVEITSNNISTVSGLPININAPLNLKGGATGTLLAAQYMGLGTNTVFE